MNNVGTSLVERVRELSNEPTTPITDERIGRFVRAAIEGCSAQPRVPGLEEWEKRVIEEVAAMLKGRE